MTERRCANCDVAYGPDDMFCENCGYDFITGSLPAGDGVGAAPAASFSPPRPAYGAAPSAGSSSSGSAPSAPSSSAAATVAPAPVDQADGSGPPSILDPGEVGSGLEAPLAADVPRLRVAIEADRSFFDAMVTDDEIDFPDPPPRHQELTLAGAELHIGRTSDSRAIHPDIDVADLTGDQAVSSRHAVLRVANDGSLTITDVGSTNGTFLDDVESERITDGVPIGVAPGVAIYVGAWTRLTILD